MPIRAGVRVSGRQGRTNLGLMNIQTDRVGALPAQNFSVLRVKRDILARSSIGAIVTNVQGGGRVNRVYGADASFFLKRVWFLEGFVARMDETGAVRSSAGYARLAYRSDRLGAEYKLHTIGKTFRPAVGFVRRPDSRQHSALLQFSPRPASDLIRQLRMTASLDYITNQRNVLETRERTAAFQVQFDNGDSVTLTGNNLREFITIPFRLRRTLVIPEGVYTFNTLQARYQSLVRRDSSMTASYTTGGFWNGNRDVVSMRWEYRPGTHFKISGNYAVNWVSLPAGRWTSHLVSTGVMVPFSTDLAIMSLLQYNRDTRQLSSNIRFNWIPKPGTDFFIVYNELDTDRPRFGALNRSIAIKLTYSFAL